MNIKLRNNLYNSAITILMVLTLIFLFPVWEENARRNDFNKYELNLFNCEYNPLYCNISSNITNITYLKPQSFSINENGSFVVTQNNNTMIPQKSKAEIMHEYANWRLANNKVYWQSMAHYIFLYWILPFIIGFWLIKIPYDLLKHEKTNNLPIA